MKTESEMRSSFLRYSFSAKTEVMPPVPTMARGGLPRKGCGEKGVWSHLEDSEDVEEILR